LALHGARGGDLALAQAPRIKKQHPIATALALVVGAVALVCAGLAVGTLHGPTALREYVPALADDLGILVEPEPEELILIAEERPGAPRGGGMAAGGRIFAEDRETAESAQKRVLRQAEEIERFLREERHLRAKVSVIFRTDEVRTDARSKRAVLDITGIDEAEAFRYARRSVFQTMPVTRFDGGKLTDFGYGAEIPLYTLKRHLTVEETLRLFGSNPFSEDPDSIGTMRICGRIINSSGRRTAA